MIIGCCGCIIAPEVRMRLFVLKVLNKFCILLCWLLSCWNRCLKHRLSRYWAIKGSIYIQYCHIIFHTLHILMNSHRLYPFKTVYSCFYLHLLKGCVYWSSQDGQSNWMVTILDAPQWQSSGCVPVGWCGVNGLRGSRLVYVWPGWSKSAVMTGFDQHAC